jgi:DNA-directed RNA polymerase specialized sigma24 family protein
VLQSICREVCEEPVPPEVFESEETLIAYLLKRSKNKALEVNRKNLDADKRSLHRQVPLSTDPPDPRPSGQRVVDVADRWQHFVESLPPPWPQAFCLLRDGHSYEEAARLVNIPERTFRRFLADLRAR